MTGNDNKEGVDSFEEGKKLEELKKLAFNKTSLIEAYNFHNEYNVNQNNPFLSAEDDVDLNKHYDKIEIDGKEYNKNDLTGISKAVMKKCGVTQNKFRQEDSKFSETGYGKMMFTNGLSVSEFAKTHNLHI